MERTGCERQHKSDTAPKWAPTDLSAIMLILAIEMVLCILDGSTCMMSDWITWSPCSVSCGMGTRSRERYVKQFPEDGSMCKVPTEETEKCIVNEECCKYFIQLCKTQLIAGALPKTFFYMSSTAE